MPNPNVPWMPDYSPPQAHPDLTQLVVPAPPAPTATTVATVSATVDPATSTVNLDLNQLLTNLVTQIVSAKLAKYGTEGTVPLPNLTDFVHADARSRALRSLLIGLGLSALWGVVNVLGTMGNINWFDKNSLVSVGTMLATSVAGSLAAYLVRMTKEPSHTAPLLPLLPLAPSGTLPRSVKRL